MANVPLTWVRGVVCAPKRDGLVGFVDGVLRVTLVIMFQLALPAWFGGDGCGGYRGRDARNCSTADGDGTPVVRDEYEMARPRWRMPTGSRQNCLLDMSARLVQET